MIKRFAEKLSNKWHKPHSEVMGWVRARLSNAILHVTDRCVRGSRVKWRSGLCMEDGAGFFMIMHMTRI